MKHLPSLLSQSLETAFLFCLHETDYFDISYKWNHIVFVFLWLAYFIGIFEFCPYDSMS